MLKKIAAYLFLTHFIFTSLTAFPKQLENQHLPDHLNGYYFAHLLKKAKEIVASPGKWEKKEWTTFCLASAGTVSFLPIDNSLHRWVDRNRTSSSDSISRIFSFSGGPAVLLGFISAGYLYGELADKQGIRQTFLLSGESLLLTELIVQMGKISFGRARPYTGEGAYSFHPLSFKEKWHSFPSGHAASAWALAACWSSLSHNRYLNAFLFSWATGVSLSRIFLDKHFASDVIAGSLLGYFIGKKISQTAQDSEKRIKLSIIINHQVLAFSLNYRY